MFPFAFRFNWNVNLSITFWSFGGEVKIRVSFFVSEDISSSVAFFHSRAFLQLVTASYVSGSLYSAMIVLRRWHDRCHTSAENASCFAQFSKWLFFSIQVSTVELYPYIFFSKLIILLLLFIKIESKCVIINKKWDFWELFFLKIKEDNYI